MTTLTDFLLEQFAEDEAVAREVQIAVESGRFEDAEGTTATAYFDRDYRQGGFTITAARVLAECAAKRRIVEQWRAADKAEEEYGGEGDGWPEIDRLRSVVLALTEVLRALALPYADHPEFDEAWRP